MEKGVKLGNEESWTKMQGGSYNVKIAHKAQGEVCSTEGEMVPGELHKKW